MSEHGQGEAGCDERVKRVFPPGGSPMSWWRSLARTLAVACAACGFAVSAPTEDAPADDPDDAEPAATTRGERAEPASREEMRPPLNRDPVLIKGAPPEYPEEFVGTGVNAEVVVTMLVDRMGRASHIRVEGSPDPAFTDAALEALGQFEFLPAIKNGRVTNAPLKMTLNVREDLGDRTLVDYEGGRIELLAVSHGVEPDTPPRRLFGPRPAYPLEMLAAGKSGEVIVEFAVGDEGTPQAVRVVEATFVEFSHAVKGAVSLWRYSPAQFQGRPTPSGFRYRVSFQADEVPEATRAIAQRMLAGDTSDVVPARQVDRQPRVRSQVDPVVAREPGDDRERRRRAHVAFMVDVRGVVQLPRVLNASNPVDGYAALAAVNYWTFDPALRKKQPVPVLVTMPLKF